MGYAISPTNREALGDCLLKRQEPMPLYFHPGAGRIVPHSQLSSLNRPNVNSPPKYVVKRTECRTPETPLRHPLISIPVEATVAIFQDWINNREALGGNAQ